RPRAQLRGSRASIRRNTAAAIELGRFSSGAGTDRVLARAAFTLPRPHRVLAAGGRQLDAATFTTIRSRRPHGRTDSAGGIRVFDQMKLSAWTSGIRNRVNLPLRVELWNGEQVDLSSEQPRVKIRVPSPGGLRYLLSPSLDMLGEAYVEGALEIEGSSADMIQMGNALAETTGKPPRTSRVASAVMNLVSAHTKEKDAESIRYHYDVSNEFYQQFLDPAMVYSCAYFENGDEDLATAQQKKIDHILTKIDLQPGQTLLDIGCGWGALVIRAAQKFG